jgi:energy-coupling factor transporter ATP-binding protein EcfA2
VALIGSTGAGKSTLLNSIARSMVVRPGVLRPTTDRPTVWAASEHRAALSWAAEAIGGAFVPGRHPLAEDLALIDTPDLDSNLTEHRRMAMEVLSAADAAIYITTAARYADASPWEVLSGLTTKPLAVVINRVPSRSSGARTDLTARLRRAGLGAVPILTISEQRLDPQRGRLSPQAVQRLAALLGQWAGQAETHRLAALDTATDTLVVDLNRLHRMITEKAEAGLHLSRRVQAFYQEAIDRSEATLAQPAGRPRLREVWRRNRPISDGRLAQVLAAVDQAARQAGGLVEEAGFSITGDLLRAQAETRAALSAAARNGQLRGRLAEILERDASRFFEEKLAPHAAEVMETLRHHIDLLTALDWSHV